MKASHFVRKEGSDPISLVVLMDLRDRVYVWPVELKDALAAVASHSLTERDRVGVAGLDCPLLELEPVTPSPASVRAMVDKVVNADIHCSQGNVGTCEVESHYGALA